MCLFRLFNVDLTTQTDRSSNLDYSFFCKVLITNVLRFLVIIAWRTRSKLLDEVWKEPLEASV